MTALDPPLASSPAPSPTRATEKMAEPSVPFSTLERLIKAVLEAESFGILSNEQRLRSAKSIYDPTIHGHRVVDKAGNDIFLVLPGIIGDSNNGTGIGVYGNREFGRKADSPIALHDVRKIKTTIGVRLPLDIAAPVNDAFEEAKGVLEGMEDSVVANSRFTRLPDAQFHGTSRENPVNGGYYLQAGYPLFGPRLRSGEAVPIITDGPANSTALPSAPTLLDIVQRMDTYSRYKHLDRSAQRSFPLTAPPIWDWLDQRIHPFELKDRLRTGMPVLALVSIHFFNIDSAGSRGDNRAASQTFTFNARRVLVFENDEELDAFDLDAFIRVCRETVATSTPSKRKAGLQDDRGSSSKKAVIKTEPTSTTDLAVTPARAALARLDLGISDTSTSTAGPSTPARGRIRHPKVTPSKTNNVDDKSNDHMEMA